MSKLHPKVILVIMIRPIYCFLFGFAMGLGVKKSIVEQKKELH